MGAVAPYDALLLVSFGGPEGMADVSPFLDHVLRGRNVPPERRREVARALRALRGREPDQRARTGRSWTPSARSSTRTVRRLPLYWGNRNWHPFLADTLRAMAGDGVRRALAFVTSAYSSYSGCRQYLEDIARARAEVGPSAPVVDKLRAFHDHPGFVQANVERVREALETLPAGRRAGARIAFTAHSIPAAMATGSDYGGQLRETCALVADRVPHSQWALVVPEPERLPARSRGSSPTSWTTWTRSGTRGSRTSSWRPSGSCPTTWRSSTTSTRKRASGRPRSASGWSGQGQRGPTRRSCG